jgi:hypothetical protein
MCCAKTRSTSTDKSASTELRTIQSFPDHFSVGGCRDDRSAIASGTLFFGQNQVKTRIAHLHR